MARKQRLDSADRSPLVSGSDDSGLVGNFAVGPSGVGPVMGFRSDDFFPVAPVADAQTHQSSVGTPELGDAVESQSTDQPEDVVTSPVDEPVHNSNARRGS